MISFHFLALGAFFFFFFSVFFKRKSHLFKDVGAQLARLSEMGERERLGRGERWGEVEKFFFF